MSLIDEIKELTPQELDELRQTLNPPEIWAQARAESRDPGDHVRIRVLEDGSPVTTNAAGAVSDLSNKSLSDTLNFIGANVSINDDNRRQMDIDVGGDACYDLFMDPGGATTYTAGETHYSRLQATLDAAAALWLTLPTSRDVNVHVCPVDDTSPFGTYGDGTLDPAGRNVGITFTGLGAAPVWYDTSAEPFGGCDFGDLTIGGPNSALGTGSWRLSFKNIRVNEMYLSDVNAVRLQFLGSAVQDIIDAPGHTGAQTNRITQSSFEHTHIQSIDISYLDSVRFNDVTLGAVLCNVADDVSFDNISGASSLGANAFLEIDDNFRKVRLNGVSCEGRLVYLNLAGVIVSGATWGRDLQLANCINSGDTELVVNAGGAITPTDCIIENNIGDALASGATSAGSGAFTNSTFGPNAPDNLSYASFSGSGNVYYTSGLIPSGGAGPAPNDATYVTLSASTPLSAERVLTPQSAYTPVGGVGFIDAGANSTVTATLKDLTANWTQSGVFDISTAGNLTVLKHGAFGSGSSINANQIVNITETFDIVALSGGSALAGTLTANHSATNSNVVQALSYALSIVGSAAGTVNPTGVHSVVRSNFITTKGAATTFTVDDVRNFNAVGSTGANTTVTARYAYYAGNASGGTTTTQYGFYVATPFTAGGTNWAFYNASTANSAFGGSVQIGGTTTPATTADIRGAVTLDGVSAPSTPASDDGVLYNETGTDFLKYKEDNAAVYNLTHKHLWDAAVDVTTASTTVPPMLVGPMPNDGTIVNVYAKLTDNKTNGATSSIFDIHKITLANADSDGQGTTIYTTQANRPTIANTHMYTAAAAPDVTTFSAGDWFAIYVDQTGTTATFAVVGMHVRYT